MARLCQPKVSVVEARRQWPRAIQGSVEGEQGTVYLGFGCFSMRKPRHSG